METKYIFFLGSKWGWMGVRTPLFELRDIPYIQLITMSKLPNLELVSNYVRSSGGSRIGGKVLLGASVFSALLSVYSYFQAFGAEKEIEFRKSQLKLPVYKLSQEQLVNPPWNHENINSWLFRRVQVVGRPIIRLACNIQKRQFQNDGFISVVPLVTREDKNFQNRYGLLFSLGFVPWQVRAPSVRQRIDRVDRQKFVGFVSKLDELNNHSWFQGNAPHPGRNFYTCTDLNDMVSTSDLLNKEQASVALVERLHETGVYDERDGAKYGVDAAFTEPYPWAKTQSGALQLYKMPWDYRNDSKHYFFASLASLLVGASIF